MGAMAEIGYFSIYPHHRIRPELYSNEDSVCCGHIKASEDSIVMCFLLSLYARAIARAFFLLTSATFES